MQFQSDLPLFITKGFKTPKWQKCSSQGFKTRLHKPVGNCRSSYVFYTVYDQHTSKYFIVWLIYWLAACITKCVNGFLHRKQFGCHASLCHRGFIASGHSRLWLPSPLFYLPQCHMSTYIVLHYTLVVGRCCKSFIVRY